MPPIFISIKDDAKICFLRETTKSFSKFLNFELGTCLIIAFSADIISSFSFYLRRAADGVQEVEEAVGLIKLVGEQLP